MCSQRMTGPATVDHDGQRKRTLTQEQRDIRNAQRRESYKKKKEEDGYQEQRDQLNTQSQKKKQEDTSTDDDLAQQQRDKRNAQRRAAYQKKKEHINTKRRETDQNHRDSLTPDQKGEISARRRQRDKAMRNTPCAESIAMPRPDLATSALASTTSHTFRTDGILPSRLHILFPYAQDQIFTSSATFQQPTVAVPWTIIPSF